MARKSALRLLLQALSVGPLLAQSTSVVSLILPDFDNQTILASVISVEATATEYLLACPSGEDATDCGLGPGVTFLQGPSTLEMHLTESLGATASGMPYIESMYVDALLAFCGVPFSFFAFFPTTPCRLTPRLPAPTMCTATSRATR